MCVQTHAPILLNASDTFSHELNATTSLNSALLTILFKQHSGGGRFFNLDKDEALPDSLSLSSSETRLGPHILCRHVKSYL